VLLLRYTVHTCQLLFGLASAYHKKTGQQRKKGGGLYGIEIFIKVSNLMIPRYTDGPAGVRGRADVMHWHSSFFSGTKISENVGTVRERGHARYAESDRGSITNDDIRDDRPQRILTRHSYFTEAVRHEREISNAGR
jgi:hypothetical protein